MKCSNCSAEIGNRKNHDKKSKQVIKSKIVVPVVLLVIIFSLGACSNSSDSSSKDTSTTKVEEIANNENSEHSGADDKSNDIVVEQATTEESTEVSGYDAIDKCYEELIANNTATDWNELSKQIRELTDKYGLYQDSKNNGLGVRYAKIATNREESKVISNGDIYKGTYYIRIVADFSKGSPDIQLVDNTDSNAEQNSTEETSSELEKTSEELYFEQVKHDAEWQMMPRDECKNVTIENRTLKLEIMLSNNGKLLERYKDISNAILAIESGYDWWDTLVIDFGSSGVVTKTKDDLVDGHFEITKDDFIKE